MMKRNFKEIQFQIKQGNFSQCNSLIREIINNDELTSQEKIELDFAIDKMSRIRFEYNITEKDILKSVKELVPNATSKDIKKWRESGLLDAFKIDGNYFYFRQSLSNFIRDYKDDNLNSIDANYKRNDLNNLIRKHSMKLLQQFRHNNFRFVKPLKINITYSLIVKKNVIPEGEAIRCWMPYPISKKYVQTDITSQSINCEEYIIANNQRAQRSVYMEKKTIKNIPTVFQIKYSTVCHNQINVIKHSNILDYKKDNNFYKLYTSERPPHIIFSDKIRVLSKNILDDEKNPYLITKKIFNWINKNITWSFTQEYSIIENISDHCISTMKGDCGLQTLLFITLCRYNGIPVKWQSGWTLHTGFVGLHDWCEVYFEGYGWVPVDPSFGEIDSEDEDVRFFYLGSLDSFRITCNDDYSRDLFPAKFYPRSDTVDFQRGEVEWRGGNIYFNNWFYNLSVEFEENHSE